MKKAPVTKRKGNIYLKNKDLLRETLTSLEQDKMTDKLAEMFMVLVKRYSKRYNFANYTYNDDMQGYALQMLVQTWKAFNPEKSQNAFAFYTQCVKNSFKQFLNTERRQRDIRDKVLVKEGLNPSYTYIDAFNQSIMVEDEENQVDMGDMVHEELPEEYTPKEEDNTQL